MDASELRHTLDEVRRALDKPFAVVGNGALGHDRQQITKSLTSILEQLDKLDLTAIRALSGFVHEFRPVSQVDSLRALFAQLQAAWEKRVIEVLGPTKLRLLAELLDAASPDLLRILGREDHENSHSDLIAWLLSPKRAPNIARPALHHLVSSFENAEEWWGAIDAAIESGLTSVRREMVIGRELADADDLCRVDIVISGPKFVLAIENKVWSREHSDQTTSYWTWLEPMKCLRGGLFLSPSGATAACPQFPPVSYLGLVSALLAGPVTRAITSEEDIVLSSYLKTLARYIVPVELNAVVNAVRTLEAK